MRYRFLQKQSLRPREPLLATCRGEVLRAIDWLIQQPACNVHYDLETVGLEATDPLRLITNIGMASDEWLIGLSLIELTPLEAKPLWDWLKGCRLGGFNLHFDIKWPWGNDISPSMVGCDTAVWYRWLATEALASQPHSLEAAIEYILGWPEEDFQKSWLKEKLEEHGLKKDDMYKLSYLEPEGYTKYCALDAEASLQLERYFTDRTKELGFWDVWNDFATRILPHKIYRNVQAEYHGIQVNRAKCMEWIVELQRESLRQEAFILEHEMVKPYIDKWFKDKCDKTFKLTVSEKKEYAKESDEPWLDPESWRFQLVNNPDKLPKWQRKWGGKFYRTTPVFSVSGKTRPLPRFNFHSQDDMKYLIYECWIGEGNYKKVLYESGKGGHLEVTLNGEMYELDLTKTMGLPSGGDILKLFGEVGQMISNIKKIHKVLGDFLWKYYKASERTGSIHPSLKINGAATGRASGG
jgi:hypothetical protein